MNIITGTLKRSIPDGVTAYSLYSNRKYRKYSYAQKGLAKLHPVSSGESWNVPEWQCSYCRQFNLSLRQDCRKCGAPK